MWEHISQVEQRTEERLATLCLTSLCGGRVKCGVACLNHLHALPEKQRYGYGYRKGCVHVEGNPGSISLTASKLSVDHRVHIFLEMKQG